MSTCEMFLARLKRVRGGNGQWIAQCPAHEDRSPSLSVACRNGKVLIHCFAGCATAAVLDAAGFTASAVFGGGAHAASAAPFRKTADAAVDTWVRDRLQTLSLALRNRDAVLAALVGLDNVIADRMRAGCYRDYSSMHWEFSVLLTTKTDEKAGLWRERKL